MKINLANPSNIVSPVFSEDLATIVHNLLTNETKVTDIAISGENKYNLKEIVDILGQAICLPNPKISGNLNESFQIFNEIFESPEYINLVKFLNKYNSVESLNIDKFKLEKTNFRDYYKEKSINKNIFVDEDLAFKKYLY